MILRVWGGLAAYIGEAGTSKAAVEHFGWPGCRYGRNLFQKVASEHLRCLAAGLGKTSLGKLIVRRRRLATEMGKTGSEKTALSI